MKKAILTLIVILTSTFAIQAQTKVSLDANGNYVAAKKDAKETSKETGKTFTDSKGNVYPVFESQNGKLFVIRISKSGNEYKSYLKTEQ